MSTAHIIYAALFRLSIIAAGFGCVAMGFRLFVHGVMPKEGSDIDAKSGQISLSLKNAAPGTCFAALGVIMIFTMVVQGNPEKKIEEVPTKEGPSRKVTWRSDSEDISPAIARGRKLELDGRLNEAILAYAEPLKNGDLPLNVATQPLRAIAAVYLKQKRLDEAIAYSLLAYQVNPDDADCLALIAKIQQGRGKHADALKYISQAAQIDNAYIPERDRLKKQK